ncbi:hypothetical protein [Syntrophomonas wolfei]|nr:hypothetical protein [Syntrophomonas wolfei]
MKRVREFVAARPISNKETSRAVIFSACLIRLLQPAGVAIEVAGLGE